MSVSEHVCPACWRYGSPEMREIFSEERKLQYSLDVEAALAQAEADLGIIPTEAAAEIGRKANTQYVTPEAVFERENKIKHDVMSMVQLLSEACDGDAGKYVHLGATSYDIEDNRLALQIKDASQIIVDYLKKMGEELIEKAEKYKKLPAIGRTHVQWAEPITFGHKFARYLNDVWQDYKAWMRIVEDGIYGKPMTGAVGTADSFVHLTGKEQAVKIGEKVMETLDLKPALITDQIVSRKMLADIGHTLTQTAMTGYKIAQNLYHLWRPEIGEVAPRLPKIGVIGSSAMPQKSVLMNDIAGENMMSLARVVKALTMIAYDDIPLLHERDLSNSGAERIWLPQSFLYTNEIQSRGVKKMQSIVVDEDRITENLAKATNFTVTEPLLMTLVQKGLGRNEGHEVLQHYALEMSKNADADPVETMMTFDEISSRINAEQASTLLQEHRMYTGLSEEAVDNVLAEVSF